MTPCRLLGSRAGFYEPRLPTFLLMPVVLFVRKIRTPKLNVSFATTCSSGKIATGSQVRQDLRFATADRRRQDPRESGKTGL